MRKSLALLLLLCSSTAIASPGDLPDHHAIAPGQEETSSARVTATSAAPASVGAIAFDARVARRHDAWDVHGLARLRPAAHPGSADVLVFDLSDDPHAVESHTVTAMFPVQLPASAAVDDELVLSPNDGFEPGHTYCIQIVERYEGASHMLAQGNLALE